jgi:hypothetical protein
VLAVLLLVRLQTFVADGIRRLVIAMCDDGEVGRLCALPFTPSEINLVWDALLWKAWMADLSPRSVSGDSESAESMAQGVHYFRTLFAFMSSHQRHRLAAAAMWALAHRVDHLLSESDGQRAALPETVVVELKRLRSTALATACASLSLVPREQGYMLGKEWWPRCPQPLSIVSVDDVRAVVAATLCAPGPHK